MSLNVMQRKWADSLREPWREPKLVGSCASAANDLSNLLKQSVNLQEDGKGGECISALLIGPSGVGKSFVVKTAIESLRSEGNQVIPITLHGRICSDDKSSMRQIFSQFQKYLLGGSSLDSLDKISFRQGTLSEWCERLSKLLQECTRSDHMVVITLEDFDSFCHTKSKQSLLYNLFDLMHVKDTRFVVIGVTARPDASEQLEKRIKSRFQLRKIVVSPPDSLDEMIQVVKAVIGAEDQAPVQPLSKSKSRKSNTARKADDIGNKVSEVLSSKTLVQNWSLYRDLGYSIRDFVTATLSSLITIESISEIDSALLNCMHLFAKTSMGDVGVVKSIIGSLSLRDHIVLVGLMRLHRYRKRSKCFAHILKEIGSFEKRSTCSAVCRHSKRAYWHSFMGLVRLGLIEMIEYNGVSASVAPPPMFGRCRLTITEAYAAAFRDERAIKQVLSIIPNEVHQWANETTDIHDGS